MDQLAPMGSFKNQGHHQGGFEGRLCQFGLWRTNISSRRHVAHPPHCTPRRIPPAASKLTAPTLHHLPALPPPPVFIQRDQASPPLTPTYDGPFSMVDIMGNMVKVQKGNLVDSVAASRCKPAILEAVTPL